MLSAIKTWTWELKKSLSVKSYIRGCYWIRTSQTAPSQGCLFAFFYTLAFKKCLVSYCSFLLSQMAWKTESSTTKSFDHVQFVFRSSENWSKFKLNQSCFEKHLYRLQFSFVVSLIFRLTEQFEIVCLHEKLLTLRDPRKITMCRFVRFLNEHLSAVYRALDFI